MMGVMTLMRGGGTLFASVTTFRATDSAVQWKSVYGTPNVNRVRKKGLHVVARNFFMLLLNRAWPCLAVA